MNKIDELKKDFEKYAEKFDMSDIHILGKLEHTYRVMELCEKIAKSLNLTEKQVEIAVVIGLLHDIARFEQYTKYKTFSDAKSFDHGVYALELLEKNMFIEKFTDDEKIKKIIKEAIKNHNKFKIDASLNEEETMYSKIIRDADKLDILYITMKLYFFDKTTIEEVENGIVSKNVMEQFRKKEDLLKTKDFKPIDNFLVYTGFVFDINYKYSFEVLKNEDYINKILDKFDFKNLETINNINEIRNIVNDYLKTK